MIPSKRILNSRKRQRSTRKPSKRTRKQRGGQATTTSLGDTTSLGETTSLGDPTPTTTDTTVRALLESALTKTVTMDPTALNTAFTIAINQYTSATPEQRAQFDKISFVIDPIIRVASLTVLKPIVFDNSVDPTADTTSVNTLLSSFQNALADTVKMTPEDIANTDKIVEAQYSNATPAQMSQLRDITDKLTPFVTVMKSELINSIIPGIPIIPAQTT
jgi:hypothetical protein